MESLSHSERQRRRRRAARVATSPAALQVDAARHALERLLAACTIHDRARLALRLRELPRDATRAAARLARLEVEARACAERRAARAAGLPVPAFPEELPVVQARERIAAAIRDNPVSIVCGETGSGKTTQIPKICLALGRGVDGYIGHTQPRRVAARAVAARIAAELDSAPGRLAGHKVRFDEQVDPLAYVKVMTDGIALAEIAADPRLEAYDTLIIDEAHERSLNVDLLLGHLKGLVCRRPELRVVVTSASIDPGRFAVYFGHAPLIEVSGRSYPVELRWRPPGTDGEGPLAARVVEGVREALADGPGDVLAFLPGERDIRETAARLRREAGEGVEVLPLYARLAARAQDAVFAPHLRRRVVLATNVAETSLTVPGIRYVVDSGLARVGRFSHRSRVQRLPVEPVSQASADQRAGRCGRMGPGVCIRLYAEEDYAARPRHGDPEIVRADLAGVILQMKALALGEVERFPFLDAPDERGVRDGYRLLAELGALDGRQRLTRLGRRLARFPVEPRIARMLLAGAEHGCLAELLVIGAALAVPEPRERPAEARMAADRAHELFRDQRSDFLGYLKLWQAYRERARELGRRELERWCRKHFISPQRVREWREVHRQLAVIVAGMRLKPNRRPASNACVHRALLAGLLGMVGTRTAEGDYEGLRGRRFRIFPGSALARDAPAWVVAAELLETTHTYAHVVARVRPAWIEEAAGALVRRQWVESAFDPRSGEVVGWQRVTVHLLTLATRRRGWYGRENPQAARPVFVRQALVEGRLAPQPDFLAYNLALVERLRERAARSRAALHASDDELAEFYEARLPPGVHDAGSLDDALRAGGDALATRLRFDEAALLPEGAAHDDGGLPDVLQVNGLALPLVYRFEPGHADDGVSLRVPLAALNQLDARRFEWLVPGMLEHKVAALLRVLPKAVRRAFVPAADWARAFHEAWPVPSGGLGERLASFLATRAGAPLSAACFASALDGGDARVPAHLRMRFEVVGEQGEVLAAGRDFDALQARLGERAARSFAALGGAGFERDGITDWDFGDLPACVEASRGGLPVRGFPALIDRGDSVSLRLADNAARAHRLTREGLLCLFALCLPRELRQALRKSPDDRSLLLLYAVLPAAPPGCAPTTPGAGVARGLAGAMARHVLAGVFLDDEDDLVRSEAQFRRRLVERTGALQPRLAETQALVGVVLRAHAGVRAERERVAHGTGDARFADVDEQLAYLVHGTFLEHTPPGRLQHLPRYLEAARLRIARLQHAPRRDRERTAIVRPLFERWRERACAGQDPALERYRWLLEELRVSLFAQELGSPCRVSPQRLERLWRELSNRVP